MPDAVTKLYRCGPSKGAQRKGLEVKKESWRPHIKPLAPFGVTAVQDAVTKLYRCVVEINMKAEFKDGCGLSKEARSRGVRSGEFHRNSVETM